MKAGATGSRLLIAGDAMSEMREFAEDSLPNECGGLLIGFRLEDNVHVEHVVHVPPARASPTRLLLSKRTRERELHRVLRRLPDDSPLGYVGTWHSHPGPAGPSVLDRTTAWVEGTRASDLIAQMVVRRLPTGWVPAALIAHGIRICQAQVDLVES